MTPRELKFGPNLLEPTLLGEKKITLRLYRPEAHKFRKWELISGLFAEGVIVILQATAKTEVVLFENLTHEIVQEDGFKNVRAAFRGLKEYYPELDQQSNMAIIRYRVAQIRGIPVVQLVRS